MHQAHFRFAGARLLLGPFVDPVNAVIPVDADERAAAMEPRLRVIFHGSEAGGRSVYEAAAQVRAIGVALAAGGAAADELPADFRSLAARSGTGGRPDVFFDIADYVDTWQTGVYAKLAASVPTAWELGQLLGHLRGMLDMYFGQDGVALEDEDLTDAERIGVYLADNHRRGLCTWALPTVVGECAQARALFHDDDALRGFFAETHGHGSCGHTSWTVWLDLISRVLTDHLRDEHGSVHYQRR